MTESGRPSPFSALFDRGAAATDGEAWLRAMLDTEAALARALERARVVPPGSGAAVTAAAAVENIQNAALAAAAAATGNPVPGLVKALTERVPGEARGAVHRGATSQDIIDTAAMLLAARVIDSAAADVSAAAEHAARLAEEHARTVMTGRTLLQQAVPVTFGLVAAGWLTAIDEALAGLRRVRDTRLAVQFGGAGGTLASLGEAGPAVAELLADELGLSVPVLPWHTNRLRIVELAAALAGMCAALGKIARDVTLLAQNEVAEVRAGGAGGASAAGGSSTMPHKQNPVAAVVVLGCAKRAPGLLATLTAAAEQEHQRAAGAWHAEWEPLSDLLRLTGSATAWAADLLGGLVVDKDRMRANLDSAGGLPLAEKAAALLAPALGRLAAHDLVARAAARATSEHIPLADAMLADPDAATALGTAGIGRAEFEAALNPESYLGATAEFIRRALAAHATGNGQKTFRTRPQRPST